MKKYIITTIMLLLFSYSFAQSWTAVSNPSPAYSFSFPGTATILDTLNIKYYYYKPDSVTSFQVIEFRDTPFDSVNLLFSNALQQNGNDTLLAIAQSINASTNSVLTDSAAITSFTTYKGLEVSVHYNTLFHGKTVLSFCRFFYSNNHRTLLSFTISGYENNIQQLTAYKNYFFNSIDLQE